MMTIGKCKRFLAGSLLLISGAALAQIPFGEIPEDVHMPDRVPSMEPRDLDIDPVDPAIAWHQADYVALVQGHEIEYERVRGFPVGGKAFLNPIITYKGELADNQIYVVVEENGLGQRKCYYPDRLNEGHRFLAMLQRSDIRFKGVAPACMLPVFVTVDNKYALRWPISGLSLPDGVEPEPMTFTDPYAYLPLDELTGPEREELKTRFAAREVDGKMVYGLGVDLSDFTSAVREQIRLLDTSSAPDQALPPENS